MNQINHTAQAAPAGIVRIQVVVNMAHLIQYGHSPFRELTYDADFPVNVGDIVACPPTGNTPRWSIGMVTQVPDSSGYTGAAKLVRQHVPLG